MKANQQRLLAYITEGAIYVLFYLFMVLVNKTLTWVLWPVLPVDSPTSIPTPSILEAKKPNSCHFHLPCH